MIINSKMSVKIDKSINFDDFIDPKLKEIFKQTGDIINKEYSKIKSPELLNIYNYCCFYLKTLDTYLTKSGNVIKRKNIQQNFKDLQLNGAKFLFNLRTYLLDETINFQLGMVDDNGRLQEKTLTQEELFKNNNILFSLSQNAILLQRSLEKVNVNEAFAKNSIISMWQKILKLGQNEKFDKTIGAISTEIPWRSNTSKKREIYMNNIPDKNVYIGFAGNLRIYYYNKDNSYLYYNRGWLYEWFNAIRDNSEALDILDNSLNKGSIAPLIQKTDNVKGLKGGDVIINGQQTQIKYGNRQIITFISIRDTIKKLKDILKNYLDMVQSGNTLGIPTLADQLLDLFTDGTGKLKQDYEKKLKEVLSSLQI